VALNEATGHLTVVNNSAEAMNGAVANVTIYNLDGSVASEHDSDFSAAAYAATDLGFVVLPEGLSPVYFVKLELRDAGGKLVSDNFYWRGQTGHPDDLMALEEMAKVTLEAKASRTGGTVTVTLRNPTKNIALMTHVQLRRRDGERVLPVYYSDNYVSLTPGESRTITMEAALKDFKGQSAVVDVDGWNVAVAATTGAGVSVETNVEADPAHWPVTGLPFATAGLR